MEISEHATTILLEDEQRLLVERLRQFLDRAEPLARRRYRQPDIERVVQIQEVCSKAHQLWSALEQLR